MTEDVYAFVGRRIRQQRLVAKISIDDLEKLCGVSSDTLRASEISCRDLTIEQLMKISEALGEDLLSLVSGYPPVVAELAAKRLPSDQT